MGTAKKKARLFSASCKAVPLLQNISDEMNGGLHYGGSPATMSHFGQNSRWLFLDEKAT